MQCLKCGHIGTNVAADGNQCLRCCEDWDDPCDDWEDYHEPQDCDDGDERRRKEEEEWTYSDEGMMHTAGYYDGLNGRLHNFPITADEEPDYTNGYARGAENAHRLRTDPEVSHGPMEESAMPF
jgi:hypothetical protein